LKAGTWETATSGASAAAVRPFSWWWLQITQLRKIITRWYKEALKTNCVMWVYVSRFPCRRNSWAGLHKRVYCFAFPHIRATPTVAGSIISPFTRVENERITQMNLAHWPSTVLHLSVFKIRHFNIRLQQQGTRMENINRYLETSPITGKGNICPWA
jgi:hypothetical protein